MKSKNTAALKSAGLLCVPMLVLAGAPAVQQVVANAQAERQKAEAEKAGAEKLKAEADGLRAEAQRQDAEKNDRGIYGNRPLAKAIWAGDSELVKRLLEEDADVHYATDSHGSSPSALALVRAEIKLRRQRDISVGEYPEILDLLKSAGATE